MKAALQAAVLVAGLAFAVVPIAAQGQVQHTGASGQSFTITRVLWRNNPAPLSDDSPGTFNFELAKAKAGPGSAEGAANAYDQLTGYDASAEANDWHHSEWHISASNPTIGFTMSVGGSMTAGGWTSMVNPACSAFAACAHSAKVSLANGKKEAGVYLSGATTSASGLVSWGDVNIQIELPGVSVGWKVSPVFQVHQTGEHPITENGAPSPMPGKGFDKLDAWGVGSSCTLTIESGVWVKAYADGWWVILGWDIAQAKAYAITSFVFSVGGTDVAMQTLVDLEPRPKDSDDTTGGQGGH